MVIINNRFIAVLPPLRDRHSELMILALTFQHCRLETSEMFDAIVVVFFQHFLMFRWEGLAGGTSVNWKPGQHSESRFRVSCHPHL